MIDLIPSLKKNKNKIPHYYNHSYFDISVIPLSLISSALSFFESPIESNSTEYLQVLVLGTFGKSDLPLAWARSFQGPCELPLGGKEGQAKSLMNSQELASLKRGNDPLRIFDFKEVGVGAGVQRCPSTKVDC